MSIRLAGSAHALPPPEEPAYLPLSNTTERVLRILLDGDLARLRADSVAESLGMSGTTLRRRLRADHTCYQFLLDRARQHFGDGTWLSGGAATSQHMVNLAREGGAKVVVVDAGLLASIGMAALTAALAPPPPPEQPIHFNLPRGPDNEPA